MKQLKIKEFAEVVSGSTPKTNIEKYWDGDYPWITPAEIDLGTQYIYETQRRLTDEGLKSCSLKILKKGTVLMTSRAPIGKVAIAGVDLYCNQGFKNLICDETTVYPKYIYYWLSSKTDYLNSLGRGATFKEISKSIVEEIVVPIPSLGIQQRIAKVLDKAQQLINTRKEQIKACDEIIKSQFIEMFGNPSSNEKGWNIITIDDATDLVTYGLTVRPEYVEDGIKVISAAEIRGGEVNYNVAKQIAETDYKKLTDKSKPQKNELLFGKAGASIGYCAMIKNDEPFAITQNIARIKVKENLINPCWLMYYLKTDFIQEMCQREAKGNAIKDLQIQIIKGIPLFDCSLESQNQFAQFVQQVDKLKFEMCHSGLKSGNRDL